MGDGSCNVMVATDVAARGLDINDVQYVVNYDFPNDIENYIHRIGRTGRVNKKGKSFTLVTRSEGRFAKKLIKILKESGQEVNPELYELAKSSMDDKFARKQSRYSSSENRYKQHQTNRFGNKPRYQNRGLYGDGEEGGYNRRQPRYQNRDSDGDDGYNRNSRYNNRSQNEWVDYSKPREKGIPKRSSEFDEWDSRHNRPTLD